MVQSAHGIVELVIVKECQFVVHLGVPTAFGIVECAFIQIHRSCEVTLR